MANRLVQRNAKKLVSKLAGEAMQEYINFITSTGNNFLTSDGKQFKVAKR